GPRRNRAADRQRRTETVGARRRRCATAAGAVDAAAAAAVLRGDVPVPHVSHVGGAGGGRAGARRSGTTADGDAATVGDGGDDRGRVLEGVRVYHILDRRHRRHHRGGAAARAHYRLLLRLAGRGVCGTGRQCDAGVSAKRG